MRYLSLLFFCLITGCQSQKQIDDANLIKDVKDGLPALYQVAHCLKAYRDGNYFAAASPQCSDKNYAKEINKLKMVADIYKEKYGEKEYFSVLKDAGIDFKKMFKSLD